MLTPYPTEFPKESLSLLLDCVRGNLPATPTIAHHCWNVAGFALGKTLGADGPVVVGGEDAADADVLLSALEMEEIPNKVTGLFPWGMVLKIALKILQGYLNNV